MMAKIGMWTVFVLLFHSDAYFTPDALALRVPILVTHALMFPMAFIPLSTHPPPARAWLLSLSVQTTAALLLLDIVDYSLGTHPSVPTRGLEYVAAAAFISTAIACVSVFWAVRGNAPETRSSTSDAEALR